MTTLGANEVYAYPGLARRSGHLCPAIVCPQHFMELSSLLLTELICPRITFLCIHTIIRRLPHSFDVLQCNHFLYQVTTAAIIRGLSKETLTAA
jgi:hypothetical protein